MGAFFPNIPNIGGSGGVPIITPPFGGGSIPGLGGGGGSTLGLSNSTLDLILKGLGLGSSVLGSILNRPKRLNKNQRRILDQLLASLSSQANAPLTIDPQERATLFDAAARSAVGARNRLESDFASRGLSESGLRGEELGRVERTLQGAQGAIDLDLLRAARAQRTAAQQQLQSLLFGIPSVQGASAAGVGLESLGQVLGYLLTLNQIGRRD